MEHEELCERVAELSVEVENLKGWQKKQNGSLQSMDGKLGKMDGKIDDSNKSMSDKLDNVKMWLIGLLGGVVVSCLLLIVNLAIGR